MIPRVLEPEVMDTVEEAVDYNTMDHSQVNRAFVDDLLSALSSGGFAERIGPGASVVRLLDVGTGTALIPIEICRRPGAWQITAIDLAGAMLQVAADNITAAGLQERISLEQSDAKQLPFADSEFDVVASNSILHHIPRPGECLREMVRVVLRGGLLFIRDLVRPRSTDELECLVSLYAADANDHQRAMFGASLHAALTVDEVRTLAAPLGIAAECVRQTSDRHWTLLWSP